VLLHLQYQRAHAAGAGRMLLVHSSDGTTFSMILKLWWVSLQQQQDQ